MFVHDKRYLSEMGVDTQTYRCRIGAFHPSSSQPISIVIVYMNFSRALKTLGAVLFIGLLLLMSGVEPNPGPTPNPGDKDFDISNPSKKQRQSDTEETNPSPTASKQQLVTPMQQRLKDYGLDDKYWSRVFKDKVGVDNPEQLKYVGVKSFETLKKLVRFEWEENALKSVLSLTDEGYTDYRKTQRVDIQKRQTEAAEILKNLEKMRNEGRDRTDSLIKKEEDKLRNILNISDEAWIKTSEHKSFDDVIATIKSQFGDLKELVSRANELSPTEVIENASGGVGLRGILLTTRSQDSLDLRKTVIKAPTDVKLRSPIIQQKDETTEFSSKFKSDAFHRSLDTMGYSASASIQGSRWGFSAEAGFSKTHSEEEERETMTHQEQHFHSRVMYSIIPTASCELKTESLMLTPEALKDIRKLEILQKNTEDVNVMQSRFVEFFQTYGSHVNTGTIHFGGIYEWIATYSSQSASSKSSIKSMVQDALTAFASLSYSGFGFSAGGSVSGDYVKGHSSVSGSYEESELSRTNLRVVKLGGPQEVTSLPLWKLGLVSYNSTWSIIDRGALNSKEFKGIWELLVNHRSEFSDPISLSSTMKCAWEKLSGLNVPDKTRSDGIISSIERVESLLIRISEWIDDPNLSQSCLQYLPMLKDEVQKCAESTGNHAFWIDLLQTKPVVTDFFSKLADMKSSFNEQDASLVRYFIRKLINPAENKAFPRKPELLDWVMPSTESKDLPSVMTITEFKSVYDLITTIKDKFLPPLQIARSNCTLEQKLKIDTHITVELALATRRLMDHFETHSQMLKSVFLSTLLLPLSYNKDKFGFEHLLTIDKLELFIKEAERHNNEFEVYSRKGKMESQGFLVELAVKSVQVDTDIYRAEIAFTEFIHPFRTELLQKINEVVNKFATTSPFDFESLLIYLKQFKQGNKDFSLVQTVALNNLEQALSERSCAGSETNTSPQSIPMSLDSANEMLDLMGLVDVFPGKISIQDVMSIREEKNKDELQIRDLPWLILRKIIMVDYRARENDIAAFYSRKTSNDNGTFDMDEIGSFDDILENINNTSSKHEESINPQDVLLLLFCCCDHMLRQVLASKMFMCKLAIPLIYPFLSSEKLICSMWPLRTIYIESLDKEQKTYEVSVVDHPSDRVAFIRLGRPSWSKSKLINDVLSDQTHDTFFNRDCPLGLTDRTVANGLIETSWFVPSGKESDTLSKVIMFLNLRGDAHELDKQMNILLKISNIVFVMMNVDYMEKEECLNYMAPLHNSKCNIVLLLTNEQRDKDVQKMTTILKTYTTKIGESIKGTKFITTMKNGKQRNASDVKHDIRQAITKILIGNTGTPLECYQADITSSGIYCDEGNPKCVTGKSFAQKIMSKIEGKPGSNIKNEVTPMQGKLWHSWSTLQKQQNKSGQNSTIYEQDRIKKNMNSIRDEQVKVCNNLSPVLTDFIGYLIGNIDDKELITYSMQWLKIRLDEKSRRILPGLISQYHMHWTTFKSAKDKQNTSELIRLKERVDAAEQELADASFGFEHIIRELGQIYESVMSDGRSKVSPEVKAKVRILPDVVAKLLKLGIPLEIMDGDVANVPLSWVRAVLLSMKKLIGDKKLLSLSVLGIQSSGKSTLLNTMFGLQFAVSAGRCTRGVFVQLVQVKSEDSCPFDYVLVIDTEGLRAPELGLQKFDHDNELATLVIGMGDITIMNVKGENTAEVKDVLQIAVHAFLRLKLVNQRLNLSQSCVFIHQNVPAVNAREKMLHGRQKLVEHLDLMTLEAAAQEHITDTWAFNQVIDFDSQNHVWYFSDLWHGDPPMAPANPGYSEKVSEVKKSVLEVICKRKDTFLTISNSIEHIEDLWKGILADDFVFSFRNSLEIQAYNMMEVKYQELAWVLEQYTLKWVQKTAAIELGKCTNVDDLEGCTLRLLTLSQKDIGKKRDEVKETLDIFFDTHNLKDILIKWKQSKLTALIMLSEDLINGAKRDINEMKDRERIDLLQRTKQTELEKEINNKARIFADKLKGEKPTQSEMKDRFNDMYITWINQMATSTSTTCTPIDVEVESALYTRFHKDNAALNKEIEQHPLNRPIRINQLAGSLNPGDIAGQHISIAKNLIGVKKKSWDQCAYQAVDVADSVFLKVDVYLNDLFVTDAKFNKAYVNEILNIVIGDTEKHNAQKSDKLKFSLLPPFQVKLAVHVCRYGVQVFRAMNDSYIKKHSTKAKLEAYKSTAWQLFNNVVNQKTEEVIAATFFRDSMLKIIKENINNDLPLKVENEVLSHFSRTKYHFILDIMDDLAKKSNFSLYREYITEPHTFAFKWLTTFTNEKMFGRNSNGKTRYAELAESQLTRVISCIQKSIDMATSSVKEGMGLKMEKWIKKFEEAVREEVNIQSGALSHVKDSPVYDFPNFQRLILDRLIDLETEIKQFYEEQSALSVVWEGKTPYQKIMDKLWGCDALCPFCHEPCQNTSKDHISMGESHTCIQHRPSGIGGDRWDEDYRKDTLVVQSCNFHVQWKGVRFNCRDCDYECRKSGKCNAVGEDLQYHDIIQYKTVLPEWDIAPSSDMYSKSEYWMWFMANYRHQLKDMYYAQLPDVPETWMSINAESARNSLRRSAN